MFKRIIILSALAGALLLGSCDDDDGYDGVVMPARQSFDDGRELFFAKEGRRIYNVSWAPDGRRFAYSDAALGGGDYNVNVYDTITKEDRVLVADATWPRWSPAGDWIIYMLNGGTFYIIKPDGTGNKEVFVTPFPEAVYYNAFWSPDGSRVAVSGCLDFPEGSMDIHVYRLSTSELTRVTRDERGNEDYPLWSPDGKRIAFFKEDRIWNWTADHFTPLSYTSPTGEYEEVVWRGNDKGYGWCDRLYDWSPDGRYILLRGKQEDAYGYYIDLWAFDTCTDDLIQVTSDVNGGEFAAYGAYGPNGNLYFTLSGPADPPGAVWRLTPNYYRR